MSIKAVVTFARMSEKVQDQLYRELSEVGVDVVAILTADYDPAKKMQPHADVYRWGVGGRNEAWSEYFDIDYFNVLAKNARASLLPLVDRYSVPGMGSFDAELKLAEAFSRATEIINHSKPDIILFLKEPENPVENFLNIVAKDLGIKTLFTRTSVFPYLRAVSESWDTPILNEEWELHSDMIALDNNYCPVNDLSELSKREVENISGMKNDYVPLMDSINRESLEWPDFNLNVIKQLKRPKNFIASIVKRDHGPMFKYNLMRAYRNLQTVSSLESIGLKVYFPLHFQPELSSMPRGGEFSNQLKAIKLLSDCLPKNAKIWVKDHPTVFSQHTPVSINFRSKKFYESLTNIPKVELRSITEPSPLLQKKCSLVATVTGTCGLESMIQGKPLIIFGSATYENGPGVFKVRNNEDIFNALKKINLASNDQMRGARVREFIRRIEKISNHRGKFFSLDREIKKEEYRLFLVETLVSGIRQYKKRW